MHRALIAALDHAAGQILLDRHRLPGGIEGQIDQRKAAATDATIDDVIAQVIAMGKGSVV
jgi:hypothetical protein